MSFGKTLKKLRLEKAEMGMRNFAQAIEMDAKELGDIEHGYAPPPSEEVFWRIVEALGITEDHSPELIELAEEYRKPFVMEKMPENIIPGFVCTTDGKAPTKEKLTQLADWLNEKAVEHNKKADEYNQRMREANG